ncbi:MAG: alpha-galactosidase [Clostridia bacterium]|nr:alpha-galactosidase [Clostridia bacterium]
MSVTFHKQDSLFRLTTKNTLYAFELTHGTLVHRYYGKKRGATVPTSADIKGRVVSFSPYRDENDKAFSLDTQPLEYSYYGSGDFRPTALRIRNRHGDSVTCFEYVSHKIRRGAVDRAPLPSGRADEKTQTLDITLRDLVSDCELHLYYTVFYDCDIITRSAAVTNRSGADVVVEKLMSLCLDLAGEDYDVITLGGRHCRERTVYQRTPLFRGNLAITSRRGATSHQMNPFMAVCARGADENRGDVYGFNLVWSGSFLNECECEQTGSARIQAGLGSESFTYRLRDGETVHAPEAIMTYSPTGLGTMSRHFHDFVNRHIVPEKAKERRPVVLNSWEAFYFNINEDIMVDFAAAAADCGMDMVIMDDGWFGARVHDRAGLGDWFVNRDRFRDGLRPFVERVKATGVKFGIWVEPEMVNPDSDLYRAHPDWVVSCRERTRSLSRSQMVLDMSNPAVIDYLKASFTETFRDVPIDYFKWDMNRHISEPGSPNLAPEDQGSLSYRYMLGVYSLFDWFTKQFPHAMIENCSGGGGRYDLAMMYYTSQIWTSDNTGARDRVLIQYSSQLAYPASVMSCHVSNPKGDLHELDLKYKVAVGGILGYEFNVLNTDEAIKEEIRRQVAQYRTFDHLIQNGTHYRLASPYETELSAYYYQLGDEILLSAIHTNGSAVIGKKKTVTKLTVRTADKHASYRDLLGGGTYTGEQLRAGIEIGAFDLDETGYGAKLWHFCKL